MSDVFDFTGKVAMIVGVGSIGRAQALGFAERGADIVAADSRLEVAEAVAEEIRARARKALAVKVDVTDEKSVTDMVSVWFGFAALQPARRMDGTVTSNVKMVKKRDCIRLLLCWS